MGNLRRSDLYPNLRILRLRDPLDFKRLLFYLSGRYYIDSEKMLDDDQYLRAGVFPLRPAAQRIVQLIHYAKSGEIGVQTAIIETNYVDRDANVAYAHVRARAFRDHPRRTVRLHFFREEIFFHRPVICGTAGASVRWLLCCAFKHDKSSRTHRPSPRNRRSIHDSTVPKHLYREFSR